MNKNTMTMTRREFITEHFGEYFFEKYNVVDLFSNIDKEVDSLLDEVQICFDDKKYTFRLCDMWITFEWNKIYSIEMKIPEIADKWSSLNKLKPINVFYLSNTPILIEVNGKVKAITPIEYYFENKGEKDDYIIPSIDRFKELIWEEENIPRNVYHRYYYEYTRFLESFKVGTYESDIDRVRVRFSREDIVEYSFNTRVRRETQLAELVKVYDVIKKITGIKVDIFIPEAVIKRGENLYQLFTRKQMMDMMWRFNEREQYLLYSAFIGITENLEEFIKISLYDVDVLNKKVKIGDFEYDVDTEWLNLALELNTKDSIKIRKARVVTHFLDTRVDAILKPKYSQDKDPENIGIRTVRRDYAFICSIMDNDTKKMSKKDIDYSGEVYRIAEYVKENNISDIRGYLNSIEYLENFKVGMDKDVATSMVEKLYGVGDE